MSNYLPRKGQFAFWDYDQYPYFLGGEIVAVREADAIPYQVQVEGYSTYWFPARVVLPARQGERVVALRDQLVRERRDFDEAARLFWGFQLGRALRSDEIDAPEVIDRIVNRNRKVVP